MNALKTVLAVIGFLALVLLILLAVRGGPYYATFQSLDPDADKAYGEFVEKLSETGSAAGAMVWKAEVKQGLTPQDVELAMKSAAVEHNIKDVGELPLYKQIEAMTGKPYRFVKIYMYCNADTAARMIEFDPAYSAFLPCRVTLLEDEQKKLWLYSLNLDLMIYGGRPLPAELKAEAERVRKVILDIMKRGASGAF